MDGMELAVATVVLLVVEGESGIADVDEGWLFRDEL